MTRLVHAPALLQLCVQRAFPEAAPRERLVKRELCGVEEVGAGGSCVFLLLLVVVVVLRVSISAFRQRMMINRDNLRLLS